MHCKTINMHAGSTLPPKTRNASTTACDCSYKVGVKFWGSMDQHLDAVLQAPTGGSSYAPDHQSHNAHPSQINVEAHRGTYLADSSLLR